MVYKKKSKKVKRNIESAVVHVKSTFNNTLITVTTLGGDPVLAGSAGKLEFKGSRKGTPFAATQVANSLVKDMESLGIKNVEINLKGPGSGRDAAVRALQSANFDISVLRDVTPLPHNGPRPPKKRRV